MSAGSRTCWPTEMCCNQQTPALNAGSPLLDTLIHLREDNEIWSGENACVIKLIDTRFLESAPADFRIMKGFEFEIGNASQFACFEELHLERVLKANFSPTPEFNDEIGMMPVRRGSYHSRGAPASWRYSCHMLPGARYVHSESPAPNEECSSPRHHGHSYHGTSEQQKNTKQETSTEERP